MFPLIKKSNSIKACSKYWDFNQQDKTSKGVSTVYYLLPYTLQLVRSYSITSNSKAA